MVKGICNAIYYVSQGIGTAMCRKVQVLRSLHVARYRPLPCVGRYKFSEVYMLQGIGHCRVSQGTSFQSCFVVQRIGVRRLPGTAWCRYSAAFMQ
ncbi:hypothetical protein DUNSADRAFT_17737 [Dunaliella salina]|uniref:Encoded protein n=1 Tax=Dunaliella salina TaxID=3046 RepID=A0ABQ7G181_DUNSA|nr:hypothetical protein DUNSADRAFT_17737 [Dunaliella salina]|eukprot:KAF5828369.1 hypothetical protein DUNSADRAFT_17737 [Dunaliella salina]